MKKNWLVKLYLSFPLWGKVAAPAVGVLLLVSVFKLMKTAFWLALLAVVVYAGITAFSYFNKGKE